MRKFWFYKIAFLIIFLFSPIICKAQVVAVFPFEDFTHHDFGVNFKVANVVANALKERGLKVIYPKQILPILIKFRNMDITALNFSILREMYKKFKTRYVLIGSIGEENKVPTKFFLVLKLIEVGSGKLVWGKIIEFAENENPSILGLNQLNYKNIFNEIKVLIKRQFNLPETKKKIIRPTLDVQEVIFSSRYVKSGREIKCLVRLYFSGKKPDVLGLSPYKGNGTMVPLLPYKGNTYIGMWTAPEKQGSYTVYLISKWKKPWNFERRIFLGKYYVDNVPPKLALYFKGGRQEDGKFYIKDYLEIFPKLLEERSGGFSVSAGISKWRLEIHCKSLKKPVFVQEAPGKIPTFIIWDIKSQGAGLPPGKYIVKFMAWDLAGNKGEVDKVVYLVKTPPIPKIEIVTGKKPFIKVKLKKEYLPFILVTIDVFNGKGEKIAHVFKEGIGFSEVKAKIPIKKNQLIPPFYYSAFIEDELKNIRIIKKEEVPVVKESTTTPGYNTWVPEF